MAQGLVVCPDKNEFLLYSMLNTLGQMRGNQDVHFLRRLTYDHFSRYRGIGLRSEDYIHHSKPVSYVLSIHEPPDFSPKSNVKLENFEETENEKGSVVLPHIKHFYQNTDFEEFYSKILARYQEECSFLQGVLDRSKLKEILENVWEVERPTQMIFIPMPLENFRAGIGPSFNGVDYQVVGPPFDYSIVMSVSHEGSHPTAKRLLRKFRGKIEKRERLLDVVLSNPNYPESYKHWQTCFEEHLIRAMQEGYINPQIKESHNIEKGLSMQEQVMGMRFIRDFYQEIKDHKDNPGNNKMGDVIQSILERLDRYI